MEKDLSFLKKSLIAHRGIFNNKDVPENSLKAFQKAIEKGNIIELDVHLTKDNKVVVFHDDNLKRMTGVDGRLVDFTYPELQKLKLLNTDERIPTLEEVLELINGKVPVIIELKYDRKPGELETYLAKILDNYNGKFAVKSFHPLIIRWFKKNRPNYIRGLLVGKSYNNFLEKILSKNLFLALSNPDFISVDIKALDEPKIQKLLKKYFSLGWTVRNKEDFNKDKDKFDNLICENL